ncbi:NAD(P)/FAD-dependent oxidoreductase [Robertkochia solimangrovi]|uniref:NAD(P)/FAD-dependent oxidoreductase n=1 Tax=Robertkochia solimangrovi TaxID=2213046 RepID=UPI001180BF56|nr:FAD-dependent oxidoreductase [Robertkochia solimangrovi]TRZ43220.1 FAD-dependent oxidoreductase [Robertkochia solimangrovi]
MVDYLIVGSGLAGLAFCEELEKHKRSFLMIDDASQLSSVVAGGMYNPVILKRFTRVWRSEEQMAHLEEFYPRLEAKLGVKVDHKIPVLRRFASVEEQNNWFEAADKPGLNAFMEPKVIRKSVNHVDAPFGFGQVLRSGRIDTALLLKEYKTYLKAAGRLVEETFDYTALHCLEDHVSYKEHKAGNIVFCEGFGLKSNPYFNYLPLNGTKGELLLIRAKGFDLDFVLKSSVFLLPLGNDLYKVGATYKWKDKTQEPTVESKEELEDKLRSFFKGSYEVIDQFAGIRPTVADRRPLVGRHPVYDRYYVLNGLGSRGVMIGPYAAPQLFAYIENEIPMDPEMDIVRYKKKYQAIS